MSAEHNMVLQYGIMSIGRSGFIACSFYAKCCFKERIFENIRSFFKRRLEAILTEWFMIWSSAYCWLYHSYCVDDIEWNHLKNRMKPFKKYKEKKHKALTSRPWFDHSGKRGKYLGNRVECFISRNSEIIFVKVCFCIRIGEDMHTETTKVIKVYAGHRFHYFRVPLQK